VVSDQSGKDDGLALAGLQCIDSVHDTDSALDIVLDPGSLAASLHSCQGCDGLEEDHLDSLDCPNSPDSLDETHRPGIPGIPGIDYPDNHRRHGGVTLVPSFSLGSQNSDRSEFSRIQRTLLE
jgi:hypothetical protein